MDRLIRIWCQNEGHTDAVTFQKRTEYVPSRLPYRAELDANHDLTGYVLVDGAFLELRKRLLRWMPKV